MAASGRAIRSRNIRRPNITPRNRICRFAPSSDEVLKHTLAGKPLVDVRSPGEYTGEMLHMPDYPQEGALRGGHIPGAVSIPWAKAAAEDGTFKPAKELEKLYCKENGLSRRGRTIAYCRIGERSSHTWFVLKYLLGFNNVKNYDGSWTEWGNMVGVPIATRRGAGHRGRTKEPEAGKPRADGMSRVQGAERMKVDEIVAEFADLEPRERLELLLEFAENLPPLAGAISGRARCRPAPHCGMPDADIHLGRTRRRPRPNSRRCAPEAPTVKGFVGILVDAFNGQTPETVLATPPDLLQRLGPA